MEKDWVKIYTIDKLYKAELLKDILKDEEIDSVIINKQDSSYLSFGDIEIYVKSENIIKAKYLINKIKI
ncbi:MAG: DUF2007 domain-containing protein [Bacteroidales bacterium]|nr:DUF2007 domain-containing protein [Bacteroidales bacterium]